MLHFFTADSKVKNFKLKISNAQTETPLLCNISVTTL